MKQKIRVPWTDEELIILKEKYKDTKSRELEKLLPMHSRKAIIYKANSLGIYKVSEYFLEAQRNRKKTKHIISNRIYKNDPIKFFESETREKYYVLGFITGDGNVTGNTLSIKLQKGDFDHLQKISKFIIGEDDVIIKESHEKDKKNPGTRKLYQSSYFGITNKNLVSLLNKFGIVENKTFIVDPLDANIPEEFELNYLMGIIDSDGCISRYTSKEYAKRKRDVLYLTIVGNPYVIGWCNNIINKYIDSLRFIQYPKIYKENKKICSISYTYQKVIDILSILYKENIDLCLDRKYQVFKKYITEKSL